MAQPPPASSEFVIRASGADKAAVRHLVCRFPLAFRSDAAAGAAASAVTQAPDLKLPGDAWVMGQMEETEAKPGTRGHPGQWVLEESTHGRPRFVGQLEGGAGGAGGGGGAASSYFLLMKGRGNEFLAVPVNDMLALKPASQRRNQTLEEAEAAMQAHRAHHERANPRLAQAGARDASNAAADGAAPPFKGGGGDEDEADSDEEWKEIKARAAARQHTAPKQQQQAAAQPGKQQQQAAARQRGAKGGGKDGRPLEDAGEDAGDEADKGEDWEHEDEAADDDLDMGEGEDDEDEVAAPSPVRKGVGSDSEEEGGAGGGAVLQPEKQKRRLRRIMRATGLDDSEEDEEEEDDDDEEGGEEEGSESIRDEEDLDRMAMAGSGALPAAVAEAAAVAAGREPTPETQLRLPVAAAGASKKRKSPTPPAAGLAAAALQQGASAAGTVEQQQQGGKRARTGAVLAAEAAAAPPPAAAAPAAAGGVTAEELKQLIRSKGRILLSDLTSLYKARLTPDTSKAFVALVKQVARIEPGSKYLVLKE